MTKNWVRGLLWLCVLSVALMIFSFSGQDGETSLGLSHQLVQPVVEWAREKDPTMSEQAADALYWDLQQVIRKAGHLGEYALLGFFLRLLCGSYALKRGSLVCWCSGTLYAATDEIHQFFTEARSPGVLDVLIDSAGICLGMLAAMLLFGKRIKEAVFDDDHS